MWINSTPILPVVRVGWRQVVENFFLRYSRTQIQIDGGYGTRAQRLVAKRLRGD